MSALPTCLALIWFAWSAQNPPGKVALVVRGPAVVAFFPAVDEQKTQRDIDTVAALDDFRHYAAKVSPILSQRGITFKQVYAGEFRITTGRKTRQFRPARPVGYYLILPGRSPRVHYGVATDADLLHFVDGYFGASTR